MKRATCLGCVFFFAWTQAHYIELSVRFFPHSLHKEHRAVEIENKKNREKLQKETEGEKTKDKT